ncbi:hypothetical protein GF373_14745, partial [bacterium]|nr:hypothetical protein [bacterium]
MTLHTLKTWLAGDRVNDLAASQFQFAPWITPSLGFLLIAVLAAMTAYLYWPRLKELTLWPRIIIMLLRTLAVSIIIFLLLNPCWEGQIMEPGTQTAALLFDNSKSMRITGPDSRSRGGRVLQQIKKTDFVEKLQNKYQVMQYQFGEGIEFIADAQSLSFNHPSTKIHEALHLAMKEKESRNIT